MKKQTRPLNNVFSIEQQQQRPVECQWLHRLINQRSFKLSVFTIACILNIVDLCVDWYFFMSKATIQKGLVFGPPPRNTLFAIFIFCIISTFTSLLEIIQITRDTCQNRLTSLFGQITNCLTIWLEDVPLLTLNLLIVICRDGEVTYISIAKAVVGIVAALIRFLSILLNKWLIRHDYQRKDRRSQVFNTISTFGVVLVFLLSVTIHIIASLPIDSFGRLYLERPSDFQRFKFAHQKYFNHVGIFLRSTDEYDKYIYLTDIDNVIEQSPRAFLYSINEKENVFCINQTCFIRLNGTDIRKYDKQLTDKLINYSITFQFQSPDFYYLLGDIHYNVIRCDFHDFYINDEKIFLHYFRLKHNFNQTQTPFLFHENDNQIYRYYDLNQDFETLGNLWRTGLSKCSSTSSYSPHRSLNIEVKNCY